MTWVRTCLVYIQVKSGFSSADRDESSNWRLYLARIIYWINWPRSQRGELLIRSMQIIWWLCHPLQPPLPLWCLCAHPRACWVWRRTTPVASLIRLLAQFRGRTLILEFFDKQLTIIYLYFLSNEVRICVPYYNTLKFVKNKIGG